MIKTGNPVISIYTEMTPNPETMKFVANKLLYPGKSIDFPDVESAKPSALATELFGFPFIRAVFIASNFVTLTKTGDAEWNDVIPSIRQFLKDYLEEGKAVVNEEEVANIKPISSNEVAADDDDVHDDLGTCRWRPAEQAPCGTRGKVVPPPTYARGATEWSRRDPLA